MVVESRATPPHPPGLSPPPSPAKIIAIGRPDRLQLGEVRTISTGFYYTNQGKVPPHSSTCLAKIRKLVRPPLPTPCTGMSYVTRPVHARTLRS
ncbi:uncharacterized protein PgNI_08524 [Pyricularia grisea]|uniref:Uncharacterized protein n=1 Tax=Pyricularia grisea TaxID=148305 RepID=A0A6P8AUQ1_PYRGI|nr:uncharacterized protein PgNI_08524 [Pyricularia grisea]TLD05951.1 hypothetical protein PgNI_08524 [Pyricularia grisea]